MRNDAIPTGAPAANGERLRNAIRERYALISWLILLLAIALRFWNLGGASLWFDEAVYANNSMTDFRSFVENTRTRNSSPILLPLLYHVFGETLRDPLLIRLPPAIFSILAVFVLLRLPKAGVSHAAAALSAFIIAIAPAQILYAQEVREYSLSVLVSCLLIYAYSCCVNRPGNRSLALFSLFLLLAPLASNGTIFMGLATMTALVLVGRSNHRYPTSHLFAPMIALIIGITVTYHLTAKYQMGVAESWYLKGYYPPGFVPGTIKWLGNSLASYFREAIGSRQTGLAAMMCVFAYTLATVYAAKSWRGLDHLVLAFIVLVMGSIAAAALHAYPFGGVRQQLFATPLVALGTAQSVLALGARLPFSNGATAAATVCALVVATGSMPRIGAQYGEREDVVAAVSDGLAGVPDSEVYVYPAAKPAVAFHYPERRFVPGTWSEDIGELGEQIIEMADGCRVSLLFSHVTRAQDDAILEYLASRGMRTVEDQRYLGARVVTVSLCNDPG